VEGIWGGYKQSGMGRELGYHGLDDFIEIKQIFTDGTGLAMKPSRTDCGTGSRATWLDVPLSGPNALSICDDEVDAAATVKGRRARIGCAVAPLTWGPTRSARWTTGSGTASAAPSIWRRRKRPQSPRS
jgi:hypothetical protein